MPSQNNNTNNNQNNQENREQELRNIKRDLKPVPSVREQELLSIKNGLQPVPKQEKAPVNIAPVEEVPPKREADPDDFLAILPPIQKLEKKNEINQPVNSNPLQFGDLLSQQNKRAPIKFSSIEREVKGSIPGGFPKEGGMKISTMEKPLTNQEILDRLNQNIEKYQKKYPLTKNERNVVRCVNYAWQQQQLKKQKEKELNEARIKEIEELVRLSPEEFEKAMAKKKALKEQVENQPVTLEEEAKIQKDVLDGIQNQFNANKTEDMMRAEAVQDNMDLTDILGGLKPIQRFEKKTEVNDPIEQAPEQPVQEQDMLEVGSLNDVDDDAELETEAKEQPVADPAAQQQPVADPAAQQQPVADPATQQQPVADPAAQQQPVADPVAQPQAPTAQQQAPDAQQQPRRRSFEDAKGLMFTEQLDAFNKMYGTKLDANEFASSVSDAWELLNNKDKTKSAQGQAMFNQLFKDTLKQAFDIEKDAAYNGHRIPEYQEITKSANDLLRASMFAFTSIYVANSREKLFDAVTLRNKTANGDNEIIKGGRVWDMVQKSVKESPTLHLRSIANKWLAEKNSYEAMTNELNAIFANKNNKTQDVIDKLAAAKWLLLTNNNDAIVAKPKNPMTFGDRYWRAMTQEYFFEKTAFGGMSSKEIAELTKGDSLWDMDQKSDEAWEIQSKAAKDIADNWLKENKPYEKMINELNALVEANKENIIDRKEMLNKLTAAEWLLLNNDKMMVDNPEDPLNKVPNWGNRYWKALTNAREALGIEKHISMRSLIQNNYAEVKKAATNPSYTETQIEDYLLDPGQRDAVDSIETQREQFKIQQSAADTKAKQIAEQKKKEEANKTEPEKEKEAPEQEKQKEETPDKDVLEFEQGSVKIKITKGTDGVKPNTEAENENPNKDQRQVFEFEKGDFRIKITIPEENEYVKMQNAPKNKDFIIENTAKLNMERQM